MKLQLISAVLCDRGDVREENEDSVLALNGALDGQAAALFLVADGMGGLSHGAQVSQYIVTQFERWWKEDLPQMLLEGMNREEDLRELLEQEIWDINQAVLEFKTRLQCRSGSTLSLMLVYGNQYYIENIGDSRIYRLRQGSLKQLTCDQSLAAKLVREHRMTEAEARHSREQNVLTMCIGMFSVPRSDYRTGSVRAGDQFLLCSDGLYHPLEPGQLERVLLEKQLGALEKARRLRELIAPGRATDNVSMILVEAVPG